MCTSTVHGQSDGAGGSDPEASGAIWLEVPTANDIFHHLLIYRLGKLAAKLLLAAWVFIPTTALEPPVPIISKVLSAGRRPMYVEEGKERKGKDRFCSVCVINRVCV